ncbi:MAG: TraB/GumN family protein, partial [Alteraurantiacibacter sp.]|nr:TraB/GumN family protein [Alteraurantiacibacter sp.]
EEDSPSVHPRTPPLVQDYDPAPALWRLADEDTTIFMMGTIHMLPEGFRWRNAQLDTIIAQADELVVESSDADAPEMMAAVEGKVDNLLRWRRPTSLRLAPAARAKWRRLVEAQGLSFDLVDRMPLMVALMGFGTGSPAERYSSYEHGVETVLEREFASNGRPVISIEDSGRVMMSLYRLDDDLLIRDLEEDLMRWDGRDANQFLGLGEPLDDDGDWQLEHAWARGELQQVADPGVKEGKASLAFRRVLLTNRNRRWAEWLDARLDQPGTVLLAVGAAHYEGADSLLAMLEERGLLAERINAPVDQAHGSF